MLSDLNVFQLKKPKRGGGNTLQFKKSISEMKKLEAGKITMLLRKKIKVLYRFHDVL